MSCVSLRILRGLAKFHETFRWNVGTCIRYVATHEVFLRNTLKRGQQVVAREKTYGCFLSRRDISWVDSRHHRVMRSVRNASWKTEEILPGRLIFPPSIQVLNTDVWDAQPTNKEIHLLRMFKALPMKSEQNAIVSRAVGKALCILYFNGNVDLWLIPIPNCTCNLCLPSNSAGL